MEILSLYIYKIVNVLVLIEKKKLWKNLLVLGWRLRFIGIFLLKIRLGNWIFRNGVIWEVVEKWLIFEDF